MKQYLGGGDWKTLDEFKDAIWAAYRHVKQASIRRYISDIPNRCLCVIARKGGRIRTLLW
jgi:hypothetical protein